MRPTRDCNAESGGDCGLPAIRGASSTSSLSTRRSQRQPGSDDAIQSLVDAMEQMQNAMRAMQLKMERTDEAVRIVARGLDDMVPMLGSIVRRMNTLERRQDAEPRQGATIVIADGTYPPSMAVFPGEIAEEDRPESPPARFTQPSLPVSQGDAHAPVKPGSKSSQRDHTPDQDTQQPFRVPPPPPSASCTYPNAQIIHGPVTAMHRSVPCVRPQHLPARAISNPCPPIRLSTNQQQAGHQPPHPVSKTSHSNAKPSTDGFASLGNLVSQRPVVTVARCSVPSVATQHRVYTGNFSTLQTSSLIDSNQLVVQGQRASNPNVRSTGNVDASQNVLSVSKGHMDGFRSLTRPYSQPPIAHNSFSQTVPDENFQNAPRRSSSTVDASSVVPRNIAFSNVGVHPALCAASTALHPSQNDINAAGGSQAYGPQSHASGHTGSSISPARKQKALPSPAVSNFGTTNPSQGTFAPVCRPPIALPRSFVGGPYSNVVVHGDLRGNAPSQPQSRGSMTNPRPAPNAVPVHLQPSSPLVAANAAIEHLNRLTIPTQHNIAPPQNPSESPNTTMRPRSPPVGKELAEARESSSSEDSSSRGRCQTKNTYGTDNLPSLGRRLLRAAREGHTKEMDKLLKAGADVNVSTVGNCTPLHRAAAKAHAGAVSLLIKMGANMNARDSYGRTPLHMAAYNDPDCQCIAHFINAKCDLELKDRSGRTPLHSAAKFGNVAAVRALIAAGANKAAKDNKGRTPFDVAKADLVRRSIPPSNPERSACL